MPILELDKIKLKFFRFETPSSNPRCLILQAGTSNSEHVGGIRGGSHNDSAGGTSPRVRAVKSSELG